MEEERSYNLFERLLFYSLPVLFTLLLTGVLLTVFGYNVVDELLRAGNKVPIISSVLPDPKPTDEELSDIEQPNQAAGAPSDDERLAEVEALLSSKEAEVSSLRSDTASKETKIAVLEAELAALQQEAAAEAATAEAYSENIKKLAKVYAEMKPSKAAPVLENLTLNERVLVMVEMKEDQQVDIFEKMDPAIAAETSILMKDVVAVKDVQLAALQERLALMESSKSEVTALTQDEVSRTFAQMDPDLAAQVLLAMDSRTVIQIVRGMEEGARARLLNALAKQDKERTAQISESLG